MESFLLQYVRMVDDAKAEKAETPNSVDIITYQVQCFGSRDGVLIDQYETNADDQMILGVLTVSDSVGIEMTSFNVVTPGLCDCDMRNSLMVVDVACNKCISDIFDWEPETLQFVRRITDMNGI